jgi:hypothetical protein
MLIYVKALGQQGHNWGWAYSEGLNLRVLIYKNSPVVRFEFRN